MDTVLNILPVWASPECFGGFIYQDGDGTYYFHKDKMSYAEGESFEDEMFGELILKDIDIESFMIHCVYKGVIMADLYSCKCCGTAGIRKLIPYKIIRDDNGESIKFMGQICERCFEEIFDGALKTEDKNEQENTNDSGTDNESV